MGQIERKIKELALRIVGDWLGGQTNGKVGLVLAQILVKATGFCPSARFHFNGNDSLIAGHQKFNL